MKEREGLTDVDGHAALRIGVRGALQDQCRGGAADLTEAGAGGCDFVVDDDRLEEAETSVCEN